jgi:hypothetical protein
LEVQPLPPQPQIDVPASSGDDTPSPGKAEPSPEELRASCLGGSAYAALGGGISGCLDRSGRISTTGRAGVGVGVGVDVDPDGARPDPEHAIAAEAGAGLPKVSDWLPSPGVDVGYRHPLGESKKGGEFSFNFDVGLWEVGATHDREGWHGFSVWGWTPKAKEDKKQQKRPASTKGGRNKAGLSGNVNYEFPITGSD